MILLADGEGEKIAKSVVLHSLHIRASEYSAKIVGIRDDLKIMTRLTNKFQAETHVSSKTDRSA